MKKLAVFLFVFLFFISCKDKPTEPADETPPTVSILYPANNAEIMQGTEVTIKADATDKSGIKKVVFLIDGNDERTDYSEPYSYDWNTEELTGKHTIKVKAYDKNGNIGESEVITVNIKQRDPYEPNNDRSSASQITFTNNQWAANSGTEINPSTDQDWFKFNANSGEELTITCDVTSNLDAEIVLYYNGSRVARANSNGSGSDETLTYTVPSGASGTYYVGIGYYNNISKVGSPQSNTGSYSLTISKTSTPLISIEMIYVAGGTFTMGDTWGDGDSDERPTHSVTVNSFYMGKYEVTNAQVMEVFNWALAQGKITASNSTVKNAEGDSRELLNLDNRYCQISYNGSQLYVENNLDNYPVIAINWYGAAAFCNYLSEKEGLTPVYDLNNWTADWNADGYRLPTEAEWEYATKGGANGSNTKYSGSNTVDDVAWYWDNSNASGNSGLGDGHGTFPVGTKNPNELGIYDMSGNVWEWCWDWYASDYYNSSPQDNPKGPDSGTDRVLRGGSWDNIAGDVRVAKRGGNRPDYPGDAHGIFGFRILRTQ